MPAYRTRPATLADLDALVHHRTAMFVDMGVPVDPVALDGTFRPWLAEMMRSSRYRAWVVEADDGSIVAGGGITILPWPPGPHYPGNRLAFVYNVYTEPAHRHRGLARQIMDAIHAFCREDGIQSLALNASQLGRPLYEALGYAVTQSPMMFFALA